MKEPSEEDRARLKAHDAEYEARINKILDASLTDEVIHRDFERLWSRIKASEEKRESYLPVWNTNSFLGWQKIVCIAAVTVFALAIYFFSPRPRYYPLGMVANLGPSQSTSSIAKLLPALHPELQHPDHDELLMSVDFSKELISFKLADSSVIKGRLIPAGVSSEKDLFRFNFSAPDPNQTKNAFTITGELTVRVRESVENLRRIQWKNVIFAGVKLEAPSQVEFNYSNPTR